MPDKPFKTENWRGKYSRKFIEKMKFERHLRKLSQKDISNLTQISRSAISRLEVGDGALSFEYAIKIAKALNINIEDIIKD